MFRKRLLGIVRFLVIVLVLVLIAGISLIIYIQPNEDIGFSESVQVPLSNRIRDIVDNRAIMITISEEEMNGYASEQIQRLVTEYKEMEQWTVTGMHIELESNQASVTVQVEHRWGIRAEASVDMGVSWEEETQSIKLVPDAFHIKDIPLPVKWLSIPNEALRFSLQPLLPKWVYVKNLKMQDGGWQMHFGFKLFQ